MILSQKGLSIIKEFEGFSSRPYLDSGGVATIGYGTTYYPDKTPVKMGDKSISEHEGNAILSSNVVAFEKAVDHLVTSNINQNQFDALVSFTYNVGVSAFRNSTLLKVVNENPNNIKGIQKEFTRWNKVGKKVVNGLTRRRKMEANLYAEADT